MTRIIHTIRSLRSARYLTPALAAVGIVGAIIFTTSHGVEKDRPANQLSAPPESPYTDTVSGTGLVEANTRNIAVGVNLPGVVAHVYVKEGDEVKAGAPLFSLDDRVARAEVKRLEKEIEAMQAQMGTAEVMLADETDQLNRIEKLKAGTIVSVDTLQRRRFAAKRAASGLTQAEAELEAAKAAREQAEVTLEQMTVNAPVAGRILKVHVRPGEYIIAGGGGNPPMLMGGDKPLHLRVSIDENDVWRFKPGAEARASLRSNKDINFPLTFVRTEPYVQPKRNLSGDGIERVDTRVLEVVYSFDPADQPVFIGQQMDAFIQAGE